MPKAAPMFGQRPKPKTKTNWSSWQKAKGTTTQRGYGYSWEKIKKRIKFRDNNLCQPCFRKGRLVESYSVDHIRPKSQGGDDSESNLECICHPCHKRKTATERKQGGRGG